MVKNQFSGKGLFMYLKGLFFNINQPATKGALIKKQKNRVTK